MLCVYSPINILLHLPLYPTCSHYSPLRSPPARKIVVDNEEQKGPPPTVGALFIPYLANTDYLIVHVAFWRDDGDGVAFFLTV
jgi:hypothetical protein